MVDWANTEIVTVDIPTCPRCLFRGRVESRNIAVRSEANGDGTRTRKVICCCCSTPFRILFELPEGGNGEDWDR